jgi:hypothetical protein
LIETTTMPRSASLRPSYIGSRLDPVTSAPPCIHTITGAFFAFAGVQMLSVRQSSLTGIGTPE